MTITRSSINKFRSIEHALIDFGPGTNILIGPNGAGKSSILMGITWGITGSCLHTARDGKGADKMALGGAKDMMIGVEIEGLGRIERQHKPSRLSLSGSDGKPAVVQDHIYTGLKVTPEAIRVLLDPEPFTRRILPEQKQAMVKILRPAELRPTVSMIKQGITEIMGIEHLNLLHKQFKTETLRDINREGKQAEDGLKGDRPRWPFPGKEESHYSDNAKQLSAIRDKLIEKIAGVTAKREGLVDLQGIAVEEPPSDEMVKGKRKMTDKADADSAEAQQLLRLHDSRLASLVQQGSHAKIDLAKMVDPIECPADACPILTGHHKRVDALRKEIEATDAKLSLQYIEEKERKPELEKRVEEAQAEARDQAGNWAALQAELEVYKKLAALGLKNTVELEKNIGAIDTEIKKFREQLVRCRQSITRNDESLVKISTYHRENEEISHRANRLVELIEKGRQIRDVIKDIEALQKNIVEVGIGGFLEHLHKFTDPFGLGKVTYDWDSGFKINGIRLALDSGGRNQMIFEAGFRVAGAKVLGLGCVFIDYVAPLTREHWARLVNQLTKSDLQVILTYTTGKPPKIASNGSFKAFWLELDEGLTKVVEL